MPIGLRYDSAGIKATRIKLQASLYVPGARFGARLLSSVKVVGAVALVVALPSCFAGLRATLLVPLREASKSVGIWSGVMSVERDC